MGSPQADIAINIHSDEFPIPPPRLSRLLDPKDPAGLKELGGLQGLERDLRTNIKTGLPASSGASDSLEQKRIEKYGTNILPPTPRETFLHIVWGALQDQVLLLLIGAAVLSIILGSIPATSEDPKKGWIDGVAILFAVVIVVGVTSGNDFQKQRQFAKLDAKKNDRVVKVMRGGEQAQIPIFDVLAGDVILLDTGDIVCADGVFIEGHGLKTDESSVTGESDPVKKVPPGGEGDTFMISGSQVIEGMGKMLVIAVGAHSFNGRLLLALRVPDEDTPLQEKLEVLAGNIGKFGIIAASLLLLIGIPKYFIQAKVDDNLGTERFKKDVGSDIVKLVINAITIVVVAVPEGLPLAVTIALAYGMIKMLQDNNLVRHLAACETMGGATNICSDKTGTLTQNVMTVVTAWFGGKKYGEISDKVGRELPQNLRDSLCEGISVNSTAFEATNPKGKIDFVGSKTECALLKLSQSFGYDYRPIRTKYEPYFKLYPFSSARKSMSTVIKLENGGYRIYTKGASEIILGRCDKVMLNTGGAQAEVRELDPGLRKELLDTINEFATDALRTISLGYMDIFEDRNWEEAPESGYTLLGLVGIRDPLRPEVPGAVATCQRAGITVRMVTGDNIVTAQNIAKACGILKAGGLCLEGPVFRDMPEAERRALLPRLQVLARSSPTDKQLLVGMLKEAGEVVAVTGDGTNDGPALKMADIGFSMGIAGTEVAIAASDVVLLDDNFASIVKAALWGRNIFDAIRKFIQFQLCVNVVAVVIAFVGTLSGSHGESPLTAVQLLWVNLIMDSLAALSLATEEPTPSLLERKPIGRDAHLITRKMWRFIAIHSFYQLVVNFILLYAGDKIFQHRFKAHSTEHYTIIFNTFVFMQLFNEINARRLEDEKNAFEGIHRNRFFIVILIATAAVQAIFVEFGGDFTETTHLVYWEWFICIILGALELPIGVLVRYVPIENLESAPTASSEKFDAELEDVSHPAIAGPSTVDPLMGGGSHPKTTQEYRASAQGGQVARAPQRALKRRWSLVRMAVRQIGVLNAFKAMKTYRTMQGIDQN